jgi:hypothetical protein
LARKHQEKFQLTDHACRECGGRILLNQRAVAGAAVCGESYMCADCEAVAFGSTSDLCWCGFSQRGHEGINEYMCVRLDRIIEDPWLRDAFAHSGINPGSKKIKVGMVNREAMRAAQERYYDKERY